MSPPDLIVFDLDFTLWDCGGLWVDCTRYPFRDLEDGRVVDGDGRHLKMYPDVPGILEQAEDMGSLTALASRTGEPAWAEDLLRRLGFENRFDFSEIYPGSKVPHFQSLQRRSGVSFDRMLFFDDEPRNVSEVGKLGVSCVLVPRGINRGVFEEGLELFL